MDSKVFAQAQSVRFKDVLANKAKLLDKDDFKGILEERNFGDAMDLAYEQHAMHDGYGLGYQLRINPNTGEREMFVAGSDGWKDWVLNGIDAVYSGTEHFFGRELDKVWESETGLPSVTRLDLRNLDVYRTERSKKLSKIAKDFDVDVVYGHSRGGAIVADMDLSGTKRDGTKFSGTKIGVDSAMIIAKNKNMKNYHRGSAFDYILSSTGKDNEVVNSGRSFHWAYNSN